MNCQVFNCNICCAEEIFRDVILFTLGGHQKALLQSRLLFLSSKIKWLINLSVSLSIRFLLYHPSRELLKEGFKEILYFTRILWFD